MIRSFAFVLSAFIMGLFLIVPAASAADGEEFYVKDAHGVALHGQPKYSPDFKHLEYVNPDAPKGGIVKLSAYGGFDSLNPYILKGTPAASMGLVYETLMESSADEAFTQYGLIAKSITIPKDRSWVSYKLWPEARFHDGKQISADDVVWTFETLQEKGHPFYRAYYGDVQKAEKLGPFEVKFTFSGPGNQELPLIMGQLPVLPKHFWEDKDFTATTLKAPLGSGPYKFSKIDPNRTVTYERVKDWWGKDLPINKGRYNFDTVQFDYYRDSNIMVEAFKAGQFDFRSENVSRNWAQSYDIDAVKQGKIIREEIPHEDPQGMQAFVLNLRNEKFQDIRVRQALNLLFDFEWLNKNIFYGLYKRSTSFFSNSELASSGLPEGEELEILEKYRNHLPDHLFEAPFTLPATSGDGNIRKNLRQALRLFKEAGWVLKDGKLVSKDTGEQFEFEILLVQSTMERIAQPFARNLEKAGIKVSIRTVDTSQYQNRLDNYDFDVISKVISQSLSPGNEQRDFWNSEIADVPGGRNYIGIKDEVIDELVELIITAPSRDSLITRTRALDRVLLWGWYVIPHWHKDRHTVVYWNKFQRPEISPKYGLPFVSTWWIKSD